MNTTTTSRAARRGRTALSVITAGLATGAILVGMAFAVDTLGSESHATTAEVTTSAATLQPGTPR
jgi:hypothetical protein